MNDRVLPTPGSALVKIAGLDRVWLTLIGLFTLLVAWDKLQAGRTILFILDSLTYIAPFLILAVLLAASIKASGAELLIEKVFRGHPARAILVAAMFGALSPFCSCGVIPLITAMLAAGVPLAPVMAFWIASPVMDPELFVLTSAGISVEFAVAKALFAIAMGVFAGFTVWLSVRSGAQENVLRTNHIESGCTPRDYFTPTADVHWTFWRSRTRLALFFRAFKQNTWFLTKWLVLAFFLESLMVAYIEPLWVQRYLAGDSNLIIPVAALIGMPMYLNGYAAIPLVGELMNLGMSREAAMTFMLTGAVSSIPAAIAVFAVVRLRVFFLYLAIGLVGSVLCGFLYLLVPG